MNANSSSPRRAKRPSATDYDCTEWAHQQCQPQDQIELMVGLRKRARERTESEDSDVPISASRYRKRSTVIRMQTSSSTLATPSQASVAAKPTIRPTIFTTTLMPTLHSIAPRRDATVESIPIPTQRHGKAIPQSMITPVPIPTRKKPVEWIPKSAASREGPSPVLSGSTPADAIEIKGEDEDDGNRAPTSFDISTVPCLFIDSTNTIVERYFFSSCSSIDRLFGAADGADIINSDINKLTVTIKGRVGEEVVMNVVRAPEDKFEQMQMMVKKLEALEVRVKRGSRRVI